MSRGRESSRGDSAVALVGSSGSAAPHKPDFVEAMRGGSPQHGASIHHHTRAMSTSATKAIESTPTGPRLLHLAVRRYRGIRSLDWTPSAHVNVLIGSGDTCKSSLFDALALVLAPFSAQRVSDLDYYARDIASGFEITATFLGESLPASHTQRPLWPWLWNGTRAVLPEIGKPATSDMPACIRLRCSASDSMELEYNILQPDDTLESVPRELRRALAPVRLTGDDRSERDLRLVYGSALERLTVPDRGARARLARSASLSIDTAKLDIADLSPLCESFEGMGLPSKLSLGFVGSPTVGVGALLGLCSSVSSETEGDPSYALPLLAWGSGTRRLSALAVATQSNTESPILIADEVERGLDPDRVRLMVNMLFTRSGQSFVTTHTPLVLKHARTHPANEIELWHLVRLSERRDESHAVASLAKSTHIAREPEVYFARLPIVAEGDTEVGFIRQLLADEGLEHPETRGIYICNAGSNNEAATLLSALVRAGQLCAGVADKELENSRSGTWEALKSKLNERLLWWSEGSLEESVLRLLPHPLTANALETLCDHDELKGARLRSVCQRLSIGSSAAGFERPPLPLETRDPGAVIAYALEHSLPLIDILCATARGSAAPPGADKQTQGDFKGHGRIWFKSVEGGRELATKAKLLLAPHQKVRLQAFVAAIRAASPRW